MRTSRVVIVATVAVSILTMAMPARAAVDGAVAGDNVGLLVGYTDPADVGEPNTLTTEFSAPSIRRGDPLGFTFVATAVTDTLNPPPGGCPASTTETVNHLFLVWPFFQVFPGENAFDLFLDARVDRVYSAGADVTWTQTDVVTAGCDQYFTTRYDMRFSGESTMLFPCGMVQTLGTNPTVFHDPELSTGDLATLVVEDDGCPSSSIRPDGLVRVAKTTAPPLGDGVYNDDGNGQTADVVAQPGATVIFEFTVQNDGTVTDSFRLAAASTDPNVVVKWIDKGTRTNITSAVGAGSFTFADLAPGESRLVFLEAKLRRTAPRGSVVRLPLDIVSATENAARDAPVGRITVP